MGLSEFELIARYFSAGPVRREDVLLGVGDDAALLQVPAGHEVVSAIKTIVGGVHFQRDANLRALGHRALAMALSRLAAAGAAPAWLSLALTMPDADAAWLDGFSQGLIPLAQRFGMQLIGGDTTRGPLSITVVASGLVPCGKALQRRGARVGDLIYVTGTLGEAGLALLSAQGVIHPPQAARARFQARLDWPEPRIPEGRLLCGLATATNDLPSGLTVGLSEILEASAVGATLHAVQLPVSPETRPWLAAAGGWHLALCGAADYELCFTVPTSKQAAVEAAFSETTSGCTWIGIVEKALGLRCLLEDGSLIN